MDMLNILKNFEAANNGEKTSAAADTGSMKAILEGFHAVSTNSVVTENEVEECGMPMPNQMSQPQNDGTPVSMNVSINASGKENVEDIIALMKAITGSEQSATVVPNTQDMDMSAMKAAMMGMDAPKQLTGPEDDMDEDERYQASTAPDEEYSDHEYMIKDLSGGINRQKPKGSERAKDPKVESIKDQLWAALNEKKIDNAANTKK